MCFMGWSNKYFNGITYKNPHNIKSPLPFPLPKLGMLLRIGNNNKETATVTIHIENNVLNFDFFFFEHV